MVTPHGVHLGKLQGHVYDLVVVLLHAAVRQDSTHDFFEEALALHVVSLQKEILVGFKGCVSTVSAFGIKRSKHPFCVHSHPFEGHVRHLVVDVGDGVVVAEVLRHPQRDVEHPLGVIEVALVPRQDPLLYDDDELFLSLLRLFVFFTALIFIFVEDGSEPAETDAKQDTAGTLPVSR